MKVHQMVMDIYKVDEEATRAAVEKYLFQAREYKVTEYIPDEPSVTASPEVRYHGPTNVTGDQTATIAIRAADEMERRRRHVERAERAVSRLGERQRRLIQVRYMDDDDVLDYNAAEELGFSERHYRRIKSVAIYRLASTLGLIVLREE
ncbi:hypothetical protein PSTEL_09605 [Paenibacillus stellifer]|uniref:Transcriptional regulator n=1 Tax=Paenibacillus stellifer TaxID=169760 RepID=A0A089N3M0_9BACL|nr:ArpU family phage packaging/lysis transcriptional regulator [Paenibacillus stellifer]AIQ63304.1 hypothetical protein PSTEL_09605 [Paenibacillus stellifer]